MHKSNHKEDGCLIERSDQRFDRSLMCSRRILMIHLWFEEND